jgi:hypothetical protein
VATWLGPAPATSLLPRLARCDISFYVVFDGLKRFRTNLLSFNMMRNNRQIMRRYIYWSKTKISSLCRVLFLGLEKWRRNMGIF